MPTRQMPKPSTRLVLALVAAAAFGGFAATALREALEQPARAEPTAGTVPAMAQLPASVAGQPLPSLAPMLQRVLPAVVSVNTKTVVRTSPFGDDPFFRRMFPQLSQERLKQSLGSGVIVDAQRGLVLTNHHVIEGADDVSVTLADGRTFNAEFVGSDAETDVALMRIKADNLAAIPVADSGALKVGDFVVAVGNPFGVGQTVTSGIVSAVGRSNLPGVGYQNFIQTDASINPGNSGGALVDLSGRLVGINTASFNPRGSMAGNIGLGFAIPTNLAISIKDQLLANNGVVRRGTLGIDTQDLDDPRDPRDDALAASVGMPKGSRGALVTRVHAGSPAARAGLQVRDVIVAANGQRIDDAESLRNFQGLQAPDARVVLDVRRNGQALQLTTGLSELPRNAQGFDPRLAGAVFAEIPESARREGFAGVLVQSVAPGSRAAQSGLRADDVIVASSSGNFSDLAGFRASFGQPPDQLVLQVLRGNAQGRLLMR